MLLYNTKWLIAGFIKLKFFLTARDKMEDIMGKGGFSWKRAFGITKAKSRVSRSIGIPFTKSGRQRKIGKIMTGGGCLVVIIIGGVITLLLTAIAFALIW